MHRTTPTRAQVEAFSRGDEGPFVMINLLRFKAQTASGEPGEAAYARYARNAVRFVEAAGGRLVWDGSAHEVFVGAGEEAWDRALLVEYPSRAAFLAMITDPAYLEIARDREAALDRTVMLVSKRPA